MAVPEHPIIQDSDLLQVLASISSVRSTALSIVANQDDHITSQDSPNSSPSEGQQSMAREQGQLFAHAAQLRNLHRKAIMSVRQTKQETADARSEVDVLKLQLQNLVYERGHLRGEIGGCEEYE
jgi:THO complex subunit 5